MSYRLVIAAVYITRWQAFKMMIFSNQKQGIFTLTPDMVLGNAGISLVVGRYENKGRFLTARWDLGVVKVNFEACSLGTCEY